jgi:hypothetical protein
VSAPASTPPLPICACVEALTRGLRARPAVRVVVPPTHACGRPGFARPRAHHERGVAARPLYTNRDRTAARDAGRRPRRASPRRLSAERAFFEMIGRHIGDREAHVVAAYPHLHSTSRPAPHFTLHNLAVHGRCPGTWPRARPASSLSRTRCDERGLAAHLDSSNSRNIRFYERLGFTVNRGGRGSRRRTTDALDDKTTRRHALMAAHSLPIRRVPLPRLTPADRAARRPTGLLSLLLEDR